MQNQPLIQLLVKDIGILKSAVGVLDSLSQTFVTFKLVCNRFTSIFDAVKLFLEA